MYVYTVRCRFTDATSTTPSSWLDWLRHEHISDVIAAGAESAEIIQMEAEGLVYEIRYRFASRNAFLEYEREHAPQLRDKGLERFPLELGLEYSRDRGQVLNQYP